MNHVIVSRLAVLVCLLALLAMLPSPALAQEEPEDFIPEIPVEGDPAKYADDVEEEVESAEADFVLAQPPYTMNYQGYLTDSEGVPVDGAYDFAALLFDAESAGTMEWGPEIHEDVPVANGLFNLVLGSIMPLLPNDFDQALFLQLIVNGTELPRQPLRATAYAFGLVPGAEVQGEPGGTSYAFTVQNTSTAATAIGLYAGGEKYAIYANGSGDIGIYSPDFVQAKGFRSNNDSYVFVPGHVAIVDVPTSASLGLDPAPGGYTIIKSDPAGVNRAVFLPVQVPSVLYDQNVTIEYVQLYYELSDPDNTYITQVLLEQRNITTGDFIAMMNSTADKKGTGLSVASYTPADGTNVLSSSTGPVTLRILMNFQDTTDTVSIYGVRLRLGHK